jgi:hypothetical protein
MEMVFFAKLGFAESSIASVPFTPPKTPKKNTKTNAAPPCLSQRNDYQGAIAVGFSSGRFAPWHALRICPTVFISRPETKVSSVRHGATEGGCHAGAMAANLSI